MEWQLIETHNGEMCLCFIARFICDEPEYIHCAYFHGGEWYLPFDGERGSDGTPCLGIDEQPTHCAPMFKAPNTAMATLTA